MLETALCSRRHTVITVLSCLVSSSEFLIMSFLSVTRWDMAQIVTFSEKCCMMVDLICSVKFCLHWQWICWTHLQLKAECMNNFEYSVNSKENNNTLSAIDKRVKINKQKSHITNAAGFLWWIFEAVCMECWDMTNDCAVGAEQAPVEPDPVDMLDREKCVQLLAELRHAKWFQVMWLICRYHCFTWLCLVCLMDWWPGCNLSAMLLCVWAPIYKRSY